LSRRAAAQGGWSRFCFSKIAARPCVLAGHNFALQNYCSPMQPGLQRKSRKPAKGGLRNCSGKPGFFVQRDLQGKSLWTKKCARNSEILKGLPDGILIPAQGVKTGYSRMNFRFCS
jgi:hypothetical protein